MTMAGRRPGGWDPDRTTLSEISSILMQAYPTARGLEKFMLQWRPYICPFQEIVGRVPHDVPVLEVGCGIGIMPVLLSARGCTTRLIGMDVSTRAIRVAQGARYPDGVTVDFRWCPPDGAWPSEQFGAVVCVDVVHHVPARHQQAFITRLVSACAPGGTLIIKDIAPTPWWKAAANTLHDLVMSRQWAHYRAEQILLDWLRQEGTEVVEHTRLDRLWYSHVVMVARKR